MVGEGGVDGAVVEHEACRRELAGLVLLEVEEVF